VTDIKLGRSSNNEIIYYEIKLINYINSNYQTIRTVPSEVTSVYAENILNNLETRVNANLLIIDVENDLIYFEKTESANKDDLSYVFTPGEFIYRYNSVNDSWSTITNNSDEGKTL